jgi:hypothetical protein
MRPFLENFMISFTRDTFLEHKSISSRVAPKGFGSCQTLNLQQPRAPNSALVRACSNYCSARRDHPRALSKTSDTTFTLDFCLGGLCWERAPTKCNTILAASPNDQPYAFADSRFKDPAGGDGLSPPICYQF